MNNQKTKITISDSALADYEFEKNPLEMQIY
jgi:hypothetical protein